jgi:flavodoxin
MRVQLLFGAVFHAKLLVIHDSRMGNTKLAANAISEGERAADLDTEGKRK